MQIDTYYTSIIFAAKSVFDIVAIIVCVFHSSRRVRLYSVSCCKIASVIDSILVLAHYKITKNPFLLLW